MLLPEPEHRCHQRAPVALGRIVLSGIRRRIPALARPQVELGGRGVRVECDLDTPIGSHVYRHGWCDAAADTVTRLAPVGGVVVDGGANVGLFALTAAAAVGPRGRVIAIEAAPATARILRRNAEINAGLRIDVEEVALADREGEISFTAFEAGSGLSSFAPADGGEVITVRTTTLDRLVAGSGRVDVVKLDLEGAELLALRGAGRVLAEHAPALILELEPEHLARQGATVADVEALLSAAGYAPYDLALEPLATPLTRPEGEPNVVFLKRA